MSDYLLNGAISNAVNFPSITAEEAPKLRPFIDLADFNNRLELPSAVLLTGDATAKVTLQNATIRWKTFNRAGQLLAEDEQRTKVNGQREFKRIGIGVFEVIEFNNEKR